MNKTLDFLQTTDWEYKLVSGGQYNIKTCPLCFDDRHKFYISEDGLWDCKICTEAGNLYQLKGKLGGLDEITTTKDLFSNKNPLSDDILEDYIENLENDKEAYEYLTKTRGFSDKTIKHFKLGLEDDWIAIPHFQDGKLWNFKLRNYKDKEFRRVQGQPSVLFNVDNIDIDKKALVIVESETDCIAAWQMGVENVVGLTTGAGTFLPEWIPYTLKFKRIYICLNSDAIGQKGAYTIAEKLGISKCRNLVLPTNDVNDYLLETGGNDFYDLIKDSKKFSIKNVKDISEYVKDLDDWMDNDGSLSGLALPFKSIDSYLNGFKEEDLIIVAGDTGVGKTTISFNIMHHFIRNGHRCLGIFLEGKVMYYITRMMSIETKKELNELKDTKEWEEVKKRFSDYPLSFYSGAQAELGPKELIDFLKVAVPLYDIEFVMIDNLQKFVKDDRYVVQQVSQAVSTLKDLAVDHKIPILLISHIRKPEKEKGKSSMHDAKSSSTIYQDADVYLTLWNDKKNNDEEDDFVLTIEKNRMGEGGIDVDMVFEKIYAIYRERAGEAETKPKILKRRNRKVKPDWKEEGFEK